MTTPTTDREKIEKICSDMIAERAAQSSALSTQTRAVSLGVLALVWLLLGGTQATLSVKFGAHNNGLLLIAFFAVLALLLDFLQYVLALIETQFALHESMRATTVDEAGYDDGHWLRYASHCCFLAKLAMTFVAAVWLLILILAAI